MPIVVSVSEGERVAIRGGRNVGVRFTVTWGETVENPMYTARGFLYRYSIAAKRWIVTAPMTRASGSGKIQCYNYMSEWLERTLTKAIERHYRKLVNNVHDEMKLIWDEKAARKKRRQERAPTAQRYPI